MIISVYYLMRYMCFKFIVIISISTIAIENVVLFMLILSIILTLDTKHI
jgi:hypothetical protein